MKVDYKPAFDKVRNKAKAVTRRALKSAAEPVKQVVKQEAEKVRRYGFLAASIGVKVKVYTDVTNGVAVVGPKSKYKRRRKGREYRPARYAHLAEKYRHWLSAARSKSASKFQETFIAEIGRAITK